MTIPKPVLAIAAVHTEALALNSKIDTDLAILRSDIAGFRKQYSGWQLAEVIDYAIRHTFNRIVMAYGVILHRDNFADLKYPVQQNDGDELARDFIETLKVGE